MKQLQYSFEYIYLILRVKAVDTIGHGTVNIWNWMDAGMCMLTVTDEFLNFLK